MAEPMLVPEMHQAVLPKGGSEGLPETVAAVTVLGALCAVIHSGQLI